jgi:hypothetical protein
MALVACAVLAACGSDSSGLGPWQEEVKLTDGRLIVVERYEAFETHKPIADVGAAFLTNTTIKFIAPSDLGNLPMLSMVHRPIILDFDAERNVWFVIGVNERACWPTPEQIKAGHMDSRGRINLHPNFEFRLLDGQWREVEIESNRLGRAANLLVKRTTVDSWNAMRRPMPLAEKQRLDSAPGIPTEYRQVVARIGC